MPTERFYRLPREKSEAIRMAAIREFSRVSPDEVSINRIIRDAEISRGSFYTYFRDKHDLLAWLLRDSSKAFIRFYVVEIQNTSGDIWDVMERSLRHAIQWLKDDEVMCMIGNIIRNNTVTEFFRQGMEQDPEKEKLDHCITEWVYRHVDKTICPLDYESFHSLMALHMMSLALAFKEYFKDNAPLEDIEIGYRRRMRLLRYGACGQKMEL